MRRNPSKDAHDTATQHVQDKYRQWIGYTYATLIKCVLRAVLNDAWDEESLPCSGKSFHNEDTAEANDRPPQDLLVLILLKRYVGYWISLTHGLNDILEAVLIDLMVIWWWSVVAERSSLPDSSSGVSSRMWVRIPAVTLVSLSKTLNHNCFSPPRG